MGSRAAVVSLVVYLLGSVSGIQLEKNGYTKVLIAINPALSEDPQLIERIKVMVTQSSKYLFEASWDTFYFKEITILVPSKWSEGNYSRARSESYEKANIIIDEPNLLYGNDPYTQQYGECGKPGNYIHLTPTFLLDDNLIDVYGPRGKVLVHEWAHLRWGVYNEYNEKIPFYKSGGKIEATRCSLDIIGDAFELSISDNFYQPCAIDPETGSYTNNCKFFPNKLQTSSTSIMYIQSLESVNSFCNATNHNEEAPNIQNRMCNYRSAEEVIKASSDYVNAVLIQSPTPTPQFTVVKKGARVLCLVLDVSGSMAGDKLLNLRQAATLFLQKIIEDQSYVGIVTFTSTATIVKQLTLIDGEDTRQRLVDVLPTGAGGGTEICAGLASGFQVLRGDDGKTEGDEIIFLTDGESNIYCTDDVGKSGAMVHTIALGRYPHVDLQKMANISDGKYFNAVEGLDSNALIDVFASLTTSDGDPIRQVIQLESSGANTDPKACFNGTVSVDKTVGNDTSFLVLYQITAPDIIIEGPNGHIYNNSHFKPDITSKSLTLDIPGTAETGDWTYRLLNTLTRPQSLTMTVTSRAARADVAPVTVKAHMSQQSTDGSEPMVVYAEVSQRGLPVTLADVRATIESSTGGKEELQLLDNGAGADIMRYDGIYSKYFTGLKDGKFSLKVKVKGQESKARPAIQSHSRALYIPGYVVDGNVEPNPPKPPVNEDDLHVDVGRFTRTAIGESFIVTLTPGKPPPTYPPNKITDLSAEIVKDQVLLTWTAPGEDFDQGTAQSYEIRMSEDFSVLRTNFSHADLINMTSRQPQEAGSLEQHSFLPNNTTLKNGTILYFAARAQDKDLLMSSISNIAQVSKTVPSPVKPTEPPVEPSSVNIIAIVTSVIGVVVVSGIIAGTVMCIKTRRNAPV